MTVTYQARSKEMKALEGYISNPQDNKAKRKFERYFNEVDSSIIKLHQKLLASENALVYNQIYSANNRIEIKRSSADKAPLILKLRVSNSYRKFFHSINDGELLITKDWDNQFDQVKDLLVVDLNKHNYKAV